MYLLLSVVPAPVYSSLKMKFIVFLVSLYKNPSSIRLPF